MREEPVSDRNSSGLNSEWSDWSVVRNDNDSVRAPLVERYLSRSNDDKWVTPFNNAFYDSDEDAQIEPVIMAIILLESLVASSMAGGFIPAFLPSLIGVILFNIITTSSLTALLNHDHKLFDRIKLMALRVMNNSYDSNSKRHTVILRDDPYMIMLSRFDGGSVPGWFNDEWACEQSGGSDMHVIRDLSLTPFKMVNDEGKVTSISNHYLISCNSQMLYSDQSSMNARIAEAVMRTEALRAKAVDNYKQRKLFVNDPNYVVWKELPLGSLRTSPWDRIKAISKIAWAYGKLRRKLRKDKSLESSIDMMRVDDAKHSPIIVSNSIYRQRSLSDHDIQSLYDLIDRIRNEADASGMDSNIVSMINARLDRLMGEMNDLIMQLRRDGDYPTDMSSLVGIITQLNDLEESVSREENKDADAVREINLKIDAMSSVI